MTIVSSADVNAVGPDVQRAGAAEREDRELARVVSTADGLAANEVGHPRVEDLDDAHRRVLDREPQRLARRSRIARSASSGSSGRVTAEEGRWDRFGRARRSRR